MVVGELCRQNGICVHENCLYLASGLLQRGDPSQEGIYGFLVPDIRQELKRVAEQRCCFCKLPGASISCRGQHSRRPKLWTRRGRRCNRTFHLPCGAEKGCICQFFGEFRSFCQQHRPQQRRVRVQAVQQGQTPCLICMEPMVARPCYDTLVCPVCGAGSHRRCIQAQALHSGLQRFCCPHCRDVDTFRPEMLRQGVRIPDREASWEEDWVFEEPAEWHSPCDAHWCLCPLGREHVEVSGPWSLVMCRSCASRGIHQFCAARGEDVGFWECEDCGGSDTGAAHG